MVITMYKNIQYWNTVLGMTVKEKKRKKKQKKKTD